MQRRDPDRVLAEVRRILRPGGRFSFAEHVVAEAGHPDPLGAAGPATTVGVGLRGVFLRKGSRERHRSAGFSSVDLTPTGSTHRSCPFNTHIAGTALA